MNKPEKSLCFQSFQQDTTSNIRQSKLKKYHCRININLNEF